MRQKLVFVSSKNRNVKGTWAHFKLVGVEPHDKHSDHSWTLFAKNASCCNTCTLIIMGVHQLHLLKAFFEESRSARPTAIFSRRITKARARTNYCHVVL